MDDTLDRLGQTIKNALGASVTGYTVARGELTVDALAADLIKVATFLRDDPACQFINIVDVTAVDWPSREQRFRCRLSFPVTAPEPARTAQNHDGRNGRPLRR